MKICLANPCARRYLEDEMWNGKYYLESFTSFRDWIVPITKNCEMFLIDSGAFYFIMHGNKSGEDIDAYTQRYIDFINEYDFKYFFEMDLDSIVGYEKVLEFRKRIEDGTGKKVIPVWHRNRGKQAFIEMCDEYDYVAIGGLAAGEIKQEEYPYLHWFINTAHEHGAKIHGLGFTSPPRLYEYHFDSVDSTTWSQQAAFREISRFDGRYLKKYRMIGNEPMSIDLRHQINRNNLREWIEFQYYAETHL
jgi:hypothetical protein